MGGVILIYLTKIITINIQSSVSRYYVIIYNKIINTSTPGFVFILSDLRNITKI